MGPDVQQTHPEGPLSCRGPEPVPRSTAAVAKSLQEAVQGGLDTLYLHLLSLRVGLLGWYFCLKQIQWDLLRWIHASLELAIDCCFCWAQNVLLACTMGLLLAWKVLNGAKQQSWRSLLPHLALEVRLAQAMALLKSCCRAIGNLVAQATWPPACCVAWVFCCVARTLAITYEQAYRMAHDEDDEGDEDGAALGPSRAARPPQQKGWS